MDATDDGGAAPGTQTSVFVQGSPDPGGLVVSAVGYRTVGATPGVHRGLPSPYLTLIFSLEGPVVGSFSREQALGPGAASRDIVLGGLHQAPAYVRQPPVQSGLQLALHPLAARALLGPPAGALSTDIGSGADVLGPGAVELHERLSAQPDWEARFALLSGYLRRRVADRRRDRVRPEVVEAWAHLTRRRGQVTLEDLARHVALGPRRLTGLFRAETGVTPKQAARLIRFQHARDAVVRSVTAGAPPDLARIAADAGYYDHSHMVRDFRQYTGLSPTAWISEECQNIQAGGHRYGEEWDT
ncbi:helix-turn-helix domain-containing protein [Streptomyces sp. NPDC050560]|uniref:helix-turn-helix domain-containing protein n=1 Tax=Streptomyces sp. NPDC050560 TaxID=3365630 RepID=UPI0037A13A54